MYEWHPAADPDKLLPMDRYRPHLRSWLIAAVLLIVIIIAFRGVRGMRKDPHAELRDAISSLRASSDSCRWDVENRAADLRVYNRQIDSIRARVRELEALDRRGVPVDSYRVYMRTFNEYNDSVAAWAPREDTVRALDARCRAIAETHNVLADSLRKLVFPLPQ